MNNVVAQLKRDYEQFPHDQTYELYAEDVHFKDPMNEFDGLDRYREMIGFLDRFFDDIQMDLHRIEQVNPSLIATEWTLTMNAPLPWSPRLSISGRSELGLSQYGLVKSHVDYWNCSKLAVLMQVFGR
ncbi:MAG: DUF2358 domain-containing protein [Cyanobacteria bacterium P01_D01_bin.105]